MWLGLVSISILFIDQVNKTRTNNSKAKKDVVQRDILGRASEVI